MECIEECFVYWPAVADKRKPQTTCIGWYVTTIALREILVTIMHHAYASQQAKHMFKQAKCDIMIVGIPLAEAGRVADCGVRRMLICDWLARLSISDWLGVGGACEQDSV